MSYINVKTKTPNHKDLVLAKRKDGLIYPSIYYDNNSFDGFYPYTTFYVNERRNGYYYSKVDLENKFEDIVSWKPITED